MTREEFYPNYAKARQQYANEYPPNSNKPWPYDQPVQERAYNELLKKVVDPSTKEYYRSEDGKEPHKEITQIVRIRTLEGHEYLYSKGFVKFYNMYHDPTVEVCDMPEAYLHTNFLHETHPDKEGHNRRFTTGIAERVLRYDLQWNADNIDLLLEKKSPRGCSLTVKDELSGRVKECRDVEMFKTKPFEYILEDLWQTPHERELAIKEHEVTQGKPETTGKKR